MGKVIDLPPAQHNREEKRERESLYTLFKDMKKDITEKIDELAQSINHLANIFKYSIIFSGGVVALLFLIIIALILKDTNSTMEGNTGGFKFETHKHQAPLDAP